MESRLARMGGIVGLSLALSSLALLGCGKETPPPPPPQAPAPAATAQTAPAAAPAPAADPNQVQVGMTAEQVQKIMGVPAETKQEGSLLEWKYYTAQGKVEIKLQNNSVTMIERGH